MFGLLKLSLWVLLKPAKQVKYFMAFTGYSSNIYNSCVQISKIIITTPRIPDIADVQYFLQCWQKCFSWSLWSPTHVLYLLEQAVDKKVYCHSFILMTLGKKTLIWNKKREGKGDFYPPKNILLHGNNFLPKGEWHKNTNCHEPHFIYFTTTIFFSIIFIFL